MMIAVTGPGIPAVLVDQGGMVALNQVSILATTTPWPNPPWPHTSGARAWVTFHSTAFTVASSIPV